MRGLFGMWLVIRREDDNLKRYSYTVRWWNLHGDEDGIETFRWDTIGQSIWSGGRFVLLHCGTVLLCTIESRVVRLRGARVTLARMYNLVIMTQHRSTY